MQGGPERFFHSGFRQLLSGCQAKDKMGLCTGPAGGRRALGFVQDDRLTAAEMQEAGQFVRVGVARQPGGTAAHIQRQRWPGEEPARLAFTKERQRLRHRDPKAELSAAGTAEPPPLAGRSDLRDHFSALTMFLNSRPRTSKLG